MIKTIKIGSNNYDLKSSAYTMFAYKNETGRSLISDVNTLYKKFSKIQELSQEEQNDLMLEEMDDLSEKTLKLAYIMICEQNKGFKSYDEFLREIDSLYENVDWILEVLELGMTPFQGRVSNTSIK